MAFMETVGSLLRCFVRRDSSSSSSNPAAKQIPTKTNPVRDDGVKVGEAIARSEPTRPLSDDGKHKQRKELDLDLDLDLDLGPDQTIQKKPRGTDRSLSETVSLSSSSSSPSNLQSTLKQQQQQQQQPTQYDPNTKKTTAAAATTTTTTDTTTDTPSEQPQKPAARSKSKRKSKHQQRKDAAAALKLSQANNQKHKDRTAYIQALESLRMGFFEGERCEFDAEFKARDDWFELLDDDEREQTLEHRRQRNQWQHTFLYGRGEQESRNRKGIGRIRGKKHRPTIVDCPVNARVLHREYVNCASNLPVTPEGSIFVRVPEDRLDLPRALVTGPHNTPYANGLFFFDFFLRDYPHAPPLVRFLTTGNGTVRFNPNLYVCGKVCLSLLGTWWGPGWIPGASTLLQVLVSCQGLILGTDKPIFNEPGYEQYKDAKEGKKNSEVYNTDLRKQTLRWAILSPLKKIVLQEERIELRKLVLDKRRERQRSRASSPNTKDSLDQNNNGDGEGPSSAHSVDNGHGRNHDHDHDHCTAAHTPIDDKTKQQQQQQKQQQQRKPMASKDSTKIPSTKPKGWSRVLSWSFASSAKAKAKAKTELLRPTSDSELPAELPPRCDCDYPEFTTVAIRHFVETADDLEQQLQLWTCLDASRSTKQLAEEIREWQKRLLDLVEDREQRKHRIRTKQEPSTERRAGAGAEPNRDGDNHNDNGNDNDNNNNSERCESKVRAAE